jgi:type IV secretory pathway VirJ component
MAYKDARDNRHNASMAKMVNRAFGSPSLMSERRKNKKLAKAEALLSEADDNYYDAGPAPKAKKKKKTSFAGDDKLQDALGTTSKKALRQANLDKATKKQAKKEIRATKKEAKRDPLSYADHKTERKIYRKASRAEDKKTRGALKEAKSKAKTTRKQDKAKAKFTKKTGIDLSTGFQSKS